MTMVGTLGKIGSPSSTQQSQLASRLRATSFKLVFSESATLFQQTQFSKINRHKFHSNANLPNLQTFGNIICHFGSQIR